MGWRLRISDYSHSDPAPRPELSCEKQVPIILRAPKDLFDGYPGHLRLR